MIFSDSINDFEVSVNSRSDAGAVSIGGGGGGAAGVLYCIMYIKGLAAPALGMRRSV